MPISPHGTDNEAIRELRDSSKRLEKLTEELSKSSKALEHLTKILIALTILLLFITLVGLPANFPLWVIAITLLVMILITLWVFLLRKKE